MPTVNNEKVSNLIGMSASELASDDLFFVGDMSARQSKRLSAGNLLAYVNGSSSISAPYAVMAGTASWTYNVVGTVPLSSYSINALSASHALQSLNAVTASHALNITTIATMSETTSYLSYTGNHNGTASYAMKSTTALNVDTASFLQYTPGQNNGTSSHAISAGIISSGTASYSYSSSVSTLAMNSVSSSLADSCSIARSASYVSPEFLYGLGPIKAWAWVTWSVASPASPALYKSYNISSIVWRGATSIDTSNYFDHYTIEFVSPLSSTDYVMIGGNGEGTRAPSTGFTTAAPVDGNAIMYPQYPRYTTGFSMSLHTKGATQHGYFFNAPGTAIIQFAIVGL